MLSLMFAAFSYIQAILEPILCIFGIVALYKYIKNH